VCRLTSESCLSLFDVHSHHLSGGVNTVTTAQLLYDSVCNQIRHFTAPGTPASVTSPLSTPLHSPQQTPARDIQPTEADAAAGNAGVCVCCWWWWWGWLAGCSENSISAALTAARSTVVTPTTAFAAKEGSGIAGFLLHFAGGTFGGMAVRVRSPREMPNPSPNLTPTQP